MAIPSGREGRILSSPFPAIDLREGLPLVEPEWCMEYSQCLDTTPDAAG
jgi:hypothetical protein